MISAPDPNLVDSPTIIDAVAEQSYGSIAGLATDGAVVVDGISGERNVPYADGRACASRRGSHSSALTTKFPPASIADTIQQSVANASFGVLGGLGGTAVMYAEDSDGGLVTPKDNSINVIFSIWSTMMGSTVLIMPSLFRNAGIIPAFVGIAFMAALTAYTAVLFTRLGARYGATSSAVISASHNTVMRLVTLVASKCILLGACMLFHLYVVESVLAFANATMDDADLRRIVTSGTWALVLLISALRSLKPLFLASSCGVLIIGLCLIFIVTKSVQQILLGADKCPTSIASPMHRLSKPIGVSFEGVGQTIALLSTLTVSFFCHNFILQMLSECTRPAKNTRNVALAFLFTMLSYAIPSTVAAYAFRFCSGFKDNFIEVFDGPFSDVSRGAIILLVVIIYPVILFVSRTQFMGWLHGSETLPYPYWQQLLYNFIAVTVTSLPAFFQIAPTVIGALVGIFGSYWNLMLPAGLYILARRAEGRAPWWWMIGHGGIVVLSFALMVVTVLAVVGVVPRTAVLPPSWHERSGSTSESVSGSGSGGRSSDAAGKSSAG